MQIVTLGAHRSGTSSIVRLMNLMGVYVGDEKTTIGFNPENPKGFWERRDVIDLNDSIMRHYDCEWNDLHQWADEPVPLPQDLDDKIRHIILELDHHRPWVIKDPRLCQTFPLWRNHLEVPLVVIVWRDPMEVALSLNQRNNLTIIHGLAIWEHCMRAVLKDCADIPHLIIHHHDIIKEPVETTKKLFDWLQKQALQTIHLPSEKEIIAFIDPSLYRAKATDTSYDHLMSDEIIALRDYLRTGTGNAPIQPLSLISNQALEMYYETRCLFDEKETIRHFSDDQAERIRELEDIVSEFADDNEWRLTRSEWDDINYKLDRVQDHIKALEKPNRLKRFTARICSVWS